jgi:O-antigen ligase
VIAALAGYVAAADRIEGGVVDAGDHVQRQWDDFLRPAATSATGTARLTTTQGTRSDVYRVALEGWRDHPLAGEGAGAFRVRWARDRDVGEYLVNAHSLPLETLGDTGVIGLALLAAFLASLGVAAARSIRRPGALTAAEAAAVTAACAVWAAHSAVDWDWQVPALTGLVLVLAATLYPYGRRTRRAQPPAPAPDAARETPWSTPPAGAIP